VHPHEQHLQRSRENCRPSQQVDRSSVSLGNTSFCHKLSRRCSPSHDVAARSPSAARGRSNHFARMTDGRMVWSSGPLDRERRVTVGRTSARAHTCLRPQACFSAIFMQYDVTRARMEGRANLCRASNQSVTAVPRSVRVPSPSPSTRRPSPSPSSRSPRAPHAAGGARASWPSDAASGFGNCSSITPNGRRTRKGRRSLYRNLSMVEVGIYMDTSASMKRPSLHAIGSKTAKRYTAPEPVLTRYKLL
jgi:hypothetical protein